MSKEIVLKSLTVSSGKSCDKYARLTVIIFFVLFCSAFNVLNANEGLPVRESSGYPSDAFYDVDMNISTTADAMTEISKVSIGVARVNITPPVPVRMAGYASRTEPFKGVNDSLFAAATVFNDGINKAAIIKADVIGFSHQSWEELTKRIERETGIRQKFIVLAPTHTHGGPITRGYGDDKDLIAYNRGLLEKLVVITKEAANNLQPALIGSGKGICKMNMNRRALNSATGGIRLGQNPYGPVDHEVGVVRFDNLDGTPFSILVNWPTHGTVMGSGNLMITGDWPGATRRYIEREFPLPVTAIVTNGASGNINPIYPTVASFRAGETEEIGIILGREVIRVANDIRTYPAGSINALQRVITLPGKMPGGWLPGDPFEPGPDVDVRLSLLRVGNIVFAGTSGDTFTEIGMKIKEISPFRNTHVISHCNGFSGYLITDAAYPEGGYEVATTRIMSGAEKGIIDNFIEMLNDI